MAVYIIKASIEAYKFALQDFCFTFENRLTNYRLWAMKHVKQIKYLRSILATNNCYYAFRDPNNFLERHLYIAVANRISLNRVLKFKFSSKNRQNGEKCWFKKNVELA